MANINFRKNKHLTLDERMDIQTFLNEGTTFKDIARRVGKDPTTISKEVKKHLHITDDDVRRSDIYGKPIAPEMCPRLLKAPFVCNSCEKKRVRCKYRKQLYHAKKAQQEYEALLCESRQGIPLNKESFYEMDRILSEGVKRGQHLYHIMQTNDLGVSKSTVYRHLKRGYLSLSPLDFPRVVKFKARNQNACLYVPKNRKVNRTYDDFLTHTQKNNISSWVEMDTVIGRMGGKVILTLHFTFCNFMAAILLPDKTSAEVSRKIRALKKLFVSEGFCFGDILPILLTDNGGEFADVFTLENSLDGEKDTHLFYCDPMQAAQKPRVEKNHSMFRDIVPKGESFDNFTQETVNLIFSHVNSVKRKSLNGKTPFEVFTFTFGEIIATNILGIKPIPADQVVQSPKLLKK